MQKKSTSLKDIARSVGVSTALVSYVLNNKKEGRINKEVAQKIRDTAARLFYRPNHVARSLRTSKTNTIGLIVADISNPFSSALARIIEDEAYGKGYTVIFASSDENEQKFAAIIDSLLNRQVDGLIVLPPAFSQAQIRVLQEQAVPFVLADRLFPEMDANSVVVDNYSAAYEAVQHLIAGGYKKIGMVSYQSSLYHLGERERGYLAALENAKMMVHKDWLKKVTLSHTQKETEQTLYSLLSSDQPVDALLFASNQIACSALRYINSLSLKVPRQLGIVSFDETDVFDFFYAPLTYVQQPLRQIGQLSVKMLLENIGKKRKTEQVMIPARLVIRSSSVK